MTVDRDAGEEHGVRAVLGRMSASGRAARAWRPVLLCIAVAAVGVGVWTRAASAPTGDRVAVVGSPDAPGSGSAGIGSLSNELPAGEVPAGPAVADAAQSQQRPAGAEQNATVTVSVDGFTLSCPSSVAEGVAAKCTLTNASTASRDWPVVGMLHISSDADRALVRGVPVDVRWGALRPSSAPDGGVWWYGPELVGYSRFDWPRSAAAGASRDIPITIVDDDDNEEAERFYVSLAPSDRKGVGFLYTNRKAITVAASDSISSDAELQSLQVSSNSLNPVGAVQGFSSATVSYEATVGYQVTEVTVAAEAKHKRASITVGGEPLDSGAESQAISLTAGAATAIATTVTAEDGTTKTYTVNVTRGSRPETVTVSAAGFELQCPSTVKEGSKLSCSLTNSSPSAANWPVVAILHSTADDDRALIAEDSVIADTDSRYAQDLRFAAAQTPAMAGYNYGYGELFSGGSKSIYTTYGYQKFDWAGSAGTGAKRTVVIRTVADELSEPDEVFYVALAPDGYTGLSDLADNTAPVLITE